MTLSAVMPPACETWSTDEEFTMANFDEFGVGSGRDRVLLIGLRLLHYV